MTGPVPVGPPPAGPPPGAPPPPVRGHVPLSKRSIVSIAVLVVVLALIAVTMPLIIRHVVRTHLAKTYSVDGTSMEPMIKDDDRVLIERISYDFEDPSRGDVVLYDDGDGDRLARVVATAGSTVECCDPQNRIMVDGVPLDEPYRGDLPPPQPTFAPVLVPPDSLYLLGDSRAEPGRIVDEDDVEGQAVLIVYPFDHWDAITDE